MQARREEPYEEDRISDRHAGLEREEPRYGERRMGIQREEPHSGERGMGMAYDRPRLAERRAGIESVEPRLIERHGVTAAPAAEYDLVRWGPVWAGTIAAAGIFGLLMSFGANFAGAAGAITGPVLGGMAIWAVISLFVALLAGGYIAGRFSAFAGALPGLLHGFLAWSLVVALTVGLSALLGLGAAALVSFIPPNPATAGPGAVPGGPGPGAWAPFIGMVLGLIAALAGGYLGGRQVMGRPVYRT